MQSSFHQALQAFYTRPRLLYFLVFSPVTFRDIRDPSRLTHMLSKQLDRLGLGSYKESIGLMYNIRHHLRAGSPPLYGGVIFHTQTDFETFVEQMFHALAQFPHPQRTKPHTYFFVTYKGMALEDRFEPFASWAETYDPRTQRRESMKYLSSHTKDLTFQLVRSPVQRKQ